MKKKGSTEWGITPLRHPSGGRHSEREVSLRSCQHLPVVNWTVGGLPGYFAIPPPLIVRPPCAILLMVSDELVDSIEEDLMYT